MQVVTGLFTSGKVALKLLLTQFFSNILSSQYFFFTLRRDLVWDQPFVKVNKIPSSLLFNRQKYSISG